MSNSLSIRVKRTQTALSADNRCLHLVCRHATDTDNIKNGNADTPQTQTVSFQKCRHGTDTDIQTFQTCRHRQCHLKQRRHAIDTDNPNS